MALHVGILILMDLMHESFHSAPQIEVVAGPQARRIGTVLFFCTLREALMNWFIDGQLNAQNVPERIAEQLLSDNKLAHQKFGQLFNSVTGDKWAVAVEKASQLEGRDFSKVSELMKAAALHRNNFLHNGVGWDMTDEFAETCYKQVHSLVCLFVALHNVYTHPIIRRNI
jgi:hypothetical protein